MKNASNVSDQAQWNIPADLFSPEKPICEWNIRNSVLLESTTGTNQWLRENHKDCLMGTVVVANAQSAGRGRFTREWRSPANKNIYMSLLLQPSADPLQWPQATQVIAIELAQLLKSWGFSIQVKWPNDLLWNKHKVCGILAEKISAPDRHALILGLGLNVNSPNSDFAGLDRLATSLYEICGRTLNREILLRSYLSCVDSALTLYFDQGIQPWLDSWMKMENFLGSPARVVQIDKTIYGHVDGFRPDGSLWFKTENGERIAVYSGDLEV